MINLIYVLSTDAQYSKMLPTLKDIKSSGKYNIILISIEKWTNTRVSEEIVSEDFEILTLPRISTYDQHYRDSSKVIIEFIQSIKLIKSLLSKINSDESVMLYDYISTSKSFGLNEIIESFVPKLRTRFFIQKHIFSDSVTKKSKGKFVFILRIIKSLLVIDVKVENRIIFNNVILKYFLISKFRKIPNFRCCFNNQEFRNLLNFFPSQEIKLVKSSYVYDLSKFEAKTDRVDNIVFFTSGNFKYRSRKKWCDIELDFISQVNRFCIDNGIRLLIKPKDGEQVHIAEKLNFLGINSIQFYKILSESSFNPVDLPPRTCVISSIDSSVFLESLICGLPTFYYEFPDNIKKDIYLSFLPLNRIDIHSLQSYIEYSVFKINSQFLNQLRQITLEKLESDSNQSLSSLITKL